MTGNQSEVKYVGLKLTKLRKSKGFSMNELSRKSDVSVSAISRMEAGERNDPTISTLEKLAKAMGEEVDVFFGRSPNYDIKEFLYENEITLYGKKLAYEVKDTFVNILDVITKVPLSKKNDFNNLGSILSAILELNELYYDSLYEFVNEAEATWGEEK